MLNGGINMAGNLTYEEKKIIEKYINSQNVKGVEEFDVDSKRIKYNSKIKSSRDITSITGDEEFARAFLVTELVNKYGYSIENIEIEHEYTAGRPHTNTSRIDLIVRQNEQAFLFVEVKNPNEYDLIDKNKTIEEQLFKVSSMENAEGHDVKYLMLYTIELNENNLNSEAIIIDRDKFKSYSEWENSYDYLTDIPDHYGQARKIPYIKGSRKDLETDFNDSKLKRLQEDLHNVLWGGGGTDDNDVFSGLTNLILAKIQDEDEKKQGDEYDFQTKSFESVNALFDRINNLYRRALKDKLNITD